MRRDNASDAFLLLRVVARECDVLEYRLSRARAERDEIALRLVEDGKTWRDVAAVAGFANPYIAQLKKRRDGGR